MTPTVPETPAACAAGAVDGSDSTALLPREPLALGFALAAAAAVDVSVVAFLLATERAVGVRLRLLERCCCLLRAMVFEG